MALPDGVQKDIAMWKMQHALQKRMDPMYFQYAKMMRIFKKYTSQTGTSENISPMNKKIIDVFSAFKHIEADIVGYSSSSGILNSGNEITVTVTVVCQVHIWCSMLCSTPCMSLLVAHLFDNVTLQTNWEMMNFFLKHIIFKKLLFIEIHNFKKKKILEEDEDESNDQQSDAEATGNEGNVNNSLFYFLQCSRNCTVPGEGYIPSERSPTWVIYQHAANQETSVRVIRIS